MRGHLLANPQPPLRFLHSGDCSRNGIASSRKPRTAVLLGARSSRGRRWWSDLEQPHDMPEEVITILSVDGTMTNIPSLPTKLQQLERMSLRKAQDPLPSVEEQGLCIGGLFTICATNGSDASRRVNFFGFCQSTEFLFERVENAVVRRGGEIFLTERLLRSGLQEQLQMTVAVPMLWGVPPEWERVERGIKAGGGIIERVHQEWYIY